MRDESILPLRMKRRIIFDQKVSMSKFMSTLEDKVNIDVMEYSGYKQTD